MRKPQGMRFLYTRICRRYPNVIADIDRRHDVYNRNLQEVFALERDQLKQFIAAGVWDEAEGCRDSAMAKTASCAS